LDYTFIEAKDASLVEKIYEFRYKIFLEIYPEYIKSSGFTQNKEFDKYDEFSTQFVSFDEDGEISATVRLIHNSPIGYPTENNIIFDNSMFKEDKLGEMSRIFVNPKYRNIKTTKRIIAEVKKVMYEKMRTLGIEYTYGYLEESFLRLLKIYKMCYQVIGEKQRHELFGSRYPCILYTKQLGLDNPELIKLYGTSCEK